MPVKIRCTACSTVLNIPDRARGKKIKCPKCQAKLRVPAETKKQKKPVTADKPNTPDSTAFLLTFDASRVEDQNARICPKCGVDVEPEDLECPNCGVDLTTGIISARTRKRRERKGPPPEEFYSRARKESWRFLMQNKRLALRIAASWIVFSLLAIACWFMVLRCATWPPQFFWTFVGLLCAMIPFGFTWFLHTEIIRATLFKKDKLKRLHSEFFKNVALGIKLFMWIALFSLPFQLITGTAALLFWNFGMIVGAVFLGSLAFLATFMLFPIAMAHMSMPVTTPGWLAHKLIGTFGKIAAPTLYWCLLCVLTLLPVLGGLGVIGGVFGRGILQFQAAMETRQQIVAAKAYVVPRGELIPHEIEALAAQAPPSLNFLSLILPALTWILCCLYFGFASVYNMRTNGHFALYFRPELELIAEEKQAKYVAKARKDKDDDEAPSTVSTVLAFAVLTLVGAIVMGIMNEQTFLFMIVGMIGFISWAPVAGLWRIFEKAHESGWAAIVPVQREIVMARIVEKPAWWGLLLLVPGVNIPMWFLVHIEIAKKFGQGAGFGIGMALFFPIFYCILGFGEYKYGPQPE